MNKKNTMMKQETVTIAKSHLETGLKFVHSQVAETRTDLLDIGSRVLALLEELVARGVIDLRTFDLSRERIFDVELKRVENSATLTRYNTDNEKYKVEPLNIPCDELYPICKAKCCSFTFYLSHEDMEEGIVSWDYGTPYLIRQKPDGSCIHFNNGKCSIYENRPAVCRLFDCRQDKRIWSDFEKRVPAG